MPPEASAAALAGLAAAAPLATVPVLGNHDWWLDGGRDGPPPVWAAGLADDTTRPPSPTCRRGTVAWR